MIVASMLVLGQASILLDKASVSSLQAVEEIVKRGRPRKSSLKARVVAAPCGESCLWHAVASDIS